MDDARRIPYLKSIPIGIFTKRMKLSDFETYSKIESISVVWL